MSAERRKRKYQRQESHSGYSPESQSGEKGIPVTADSTYGTMTGRAHGFRSLAFEAETATELDVDGTLPEWLNGSLIRNGPGTFANGTGEVDHWFDGLAMLRKFDFGDGVRYRNRFLRTEAFEAARRGEFTGGFATGTSTLRERLWAFLFEDPYDNTNVIAERVGTRYLAMTESPRWVEFDPETLTTMNDLQYAGPEPTGQLACAHIKRDPGTDTLVNFETEFGRRPAYHVYEMEAPERRNHVATVETDAPAYMHSFALTPNYVVLTEFPFVVDPVDFLKPGRQGPFIENFQWDPDRGTRFIVIDRSEGEIIAEPRTDAVFGFHHVNAYERAVDGETDTGATEDGSYNREIELVIDLETVPDAESIGTLFLEELREGSLDTFGGSLERFVVRPTEASPSITRESIYGGGTALPTVSRARWLRSHRYVFAQGTEQPVRDWPRSILKIDVSTGSLQEWEAQGYASEPIFVPAPEPERRAEDDGVVLAVTLDPDAGTSWLIALNGTDLSERARARLPHALPFDFHGRYFPEL